MSTLLIVLLRYHVPECPPNSTPPAPTRAGDDMTVRYCVGCRTELPRDYPAHLTGCPKCYHEVAAPFGDAARASEQCRCGAPVRADAHGWCPPHSAAPPRATGSSER